MGKDGGCCRGVGITCNNQIFAEKKISIYRPGTGRERVRPLTSIAICRRERSLINNMRRMGRMGRMKKMRMGRMKKMRMRGMRTMTRTRMMWIMRRMRKREVLLNSARRFYNLQKGEKEDEDDRDGGGCNDDDAEEEDE